MAHRHFSIGAIRLQQHPPALEKAPTPTGSGATQGAKPNGRVADQHSDAMPNGCPVPALKCHQERRLRGEPNAIVGAPDAAPTAALEQRIRERCRPRVPDVVERQVCRRQPL
eukprot:4418589-Prymnesium_polylepis.1